MRYYFLLVGAGSLILFFIIVNQFNEVQASKVPTPTPTAEQSRLKAKFADTIPTIITSTSTFKVIEPKKDQVATSQMLPSKAKLASAQIVDSRYAYQLNVPKIGINAPVLAVGLEPDGKRMAVPANYTEIGWYKYSTKPGELGAAVLGAHVDNGSSVAGVFKNLKNLTVGDDIYLTDASGKTLHYKVAQRKIYDRNVTDTQEVYTASGVSRLNLITCFGEWLPGENTYAQRLVVFAELVQ